MFIMGFPNESQARMMACILCVPMVNSWSACVPPVIDKSSVLGIMSFLHAALVGFGNLMLIFEEGANKSAPLILSASSTQMIQVPIVSGDLEVSETVIAANKLNGVC